LFRAVLLFHHRAARDHDVVALLIEFDDLELERLVFEIRRIAHRAHIHQRAGQEGPYIVDLDGKAAFDAAGDNSDDDFLLLERGLETRPGASALGFLARQPGFARAIFDAVQGDFDGLADDDLDFTLFILELIGRYDRFGLQSDVDDDIVLSDFDDQPVENGARTNALARNALFKQFRETFSHVFSYQILSTIPVCPRVTLKNGIRSVKAATNS